jgi:hypothetical protein
VLLNAKNTARPKPAAASSSRSAKGPQIKCKRLGETPAFFVLECVI